MPAVAAYLREGRLSLTKLCHLREVLEPTNCLDLLEQAASRSEQEVEELAALLDPQRVAAPPRDSIRPLLPSAPLPPPATTGDLFAALSPPSPEGLSASPDPLLAAPPAPAAGSAPSPRAPLRHVIKMTVGPEFMGLLEEVRAELSHVHPGTPVATLLEEAMKQALAAWRKRSRGATERPRAPRAAARARASSRAIPAPVRREVWKRDQGRCTFIADDGHRCAATHRLQLHHQVPFARGGAATVAHIRIMCAVHNDLMARADFGDDHMNRFTGTR